MHTPSSSRIEELQEKFSSGFYTFWVKQYRISYLITLAIIILGIFAAISIPKESSPAIKLGIISISTSYFGTNPVDMDSLITDKIYKEVKDIKGIDKIQSTSALGFSSVVLTLRTDVDVKDVLSDVRSAVGRVPLPTDAKTPVITEIETDTNRTFSVYLYAKDRDTSKALLFDRASILQKEVEKVSGVNTVVLAAGGLGGPVSSGGGNESVYEVHITIPEEKLNALGLSLSSVASIIQGYNRDQPIGNFAIGEKKYDFRIEGKKKESFDFLTVPIALPKGGSITLGEIASIEREYKNDAKNILVLASSGAIEEDNAGKNCEENQAVSGEQSMGSVSCLFHTAYPYVSLTVNKASSVSIFRVSDEAKKMIESVLERPEFQGFGKVYATDLADNIRDDYKSLAGNAVSTAVLVFLAMFLFVGFRAAFFSIIALPLAFLSTFIFLDSFGYTMNFLTNFSLILAFGIAIDTVIVIVEAADAKMKIGYNPKTAIMLALKQYAVPVISGVLTTIIVFVPMMVLPGVLGKFLAYIPITVFGVLAFGLVLVLTVNNALYLLFNKRRTHYSEDIHALEYATPDEKELLMLEREGKIHTQVDDHTLRNRVFMGLADWYRASCTKMLESPLNRRLMIFGPVLLLILSIVFLAPKVGFELFPGDDNGFTSFNITGPIGQRTEVTIGDIVGVDTIFSGYPEIQFANISISGNRANIAVQLTKKDVREAAGQKDVFALEKILLDKLQVYEQKGYKVASEILQNGPPGSKALGVNLVADSPDKLPILIGVSKDFESYLKSFTGSKNVGTSSSDTPGQLIFRLDKERIATTGITPAFIYGQILQNMNGVNLGSIEDNGEDMSIMLKSSQFDGDQVIVEDILSLPLTLGPTTYRMGDFMEVEITNAIASISREDGDIQITVDGDLEEGTDTISSQSRYLEFAQNYNYPPGISYKSGGENQENSELIQSVLIAFFLSLLAIFAILTLQFQSFSQPLVILYSVFMSIPFVMLGLYLTGFPFSLTFGIGFVAFTGIAVNDAIILLTAINENLKKGMKGSIALVEAAATRLQPIMLTTITTVLGILPIALQDNFWGGMGFTIVFGIMAASALTLTSIQCVYYEVYINTNEGFIKKGIRRIMSIFGKKRSKK